jgi:hypothetical protein
METGLLRARSPRSPEVLHVSLFTAVSMVVQDLGPERQRPGQRPVKHEVGKDGGKQDSGFNKWKHLLTTNVDK